MAKSAKTLTFCAAAREIRRGSSTQLLIPRPLWGIRFSIPDGAALGAAVFGYTVSDSDRYGVVKLDRDGRPVGIEQLAAQAGEHAYGAYLRRLLT